MFSTPTRIKSEHPAVAAIRLNQELIERSAALSSKSASLCLRPPKNGALSDATALLGGAMSRSVALQTDWMQEWADFAQFAASVDGADTMAKLSDRMSNIFLRAEAQMTTQVTQSLELFDNIAVSYAYWLNQQLEDDA